MDSAPSWIVLCILYYVISNDADKGEPEHLRASCGTRDITGTIILTTHILWSLHEELKAVHGPIVL